MVLQKVCHAGKYVVREANIIQDLSRKPFFLKENYKIFELMAEAALTLDYVNLWKSQTK